MKIQKHFSTDVQYDSIDSSILRKVVYRGGNSNCTTLISVLRNNDEMCALAKAVCLRLIEIGGILLVSMLDEEGMTALHQ